MKSCRKNSGVCGILRLVWSVLSHPPHTHHCQQLCRLLQEQALEEWGLWSPYLSNSKTHLKKSVENWAKTSVFWTKTLCSAKKLISVWGGYSLSKIFRDIRFWTLPTVLLKGDPQEEGEVVRGESCHQEEDGGEGGGGGGGGGEIDCSLISFGNHKVIYLAAKKRMCITLKRSVATPV